MAARGKGKKYPSGPTLSRTRVTSEPVTGEVTEWKGSLELVFWELGAFLKQEGWENNWKSRKRIEWVAEGALAEVSFRS